MSDQAAEGSGGGPTAEQSSGGPTAEQSGGGPTAEGSGGGRLRTTVTVVQWVAVAAVVLFVVMLFAKPPSRSVAADVEGSGGEAGAAPDGAAVFTARCASCHGATGGGGNGPQLSDGRVVEQFPDIADQVAVVTDGRGGMPAFSDRLSAAEIQAVVDHTRTL